MIITKNQAKKFLAQYHFLSPARALTKEEIISKMFRRLGCIQFDTINVVGRNADLVLQSRVNGYTQNILSQFLYQERQLVDGWDKLASIYSANDWPYFERRRDYVRERHQKNAPEVHTLKPRILEAIQQSGEMSSIHFKDKSKTDWAWGPTSISRAALEALYAEGALGIHHRVNTRRHFDLIERLIPAEILNQSDPNETMEEYLDWHILRRIGSVGIAGSTSGEHWLGIHQGRKAKPRNKTIARLIKNGAVTEIQIKGLEGKKYYIQTETLPQLEAIQNASLPASAAFIAPLDNLIWNRNLVNEIFDFSYIWEVYKPKDKRFYGYYVLPVLYKENFIARVDMKFHRKTQQLELLGWWWEPDIEQTPEMHTAIQACFSDFANYLEAKSLQVNRETIPDDFIKRCLASLV